MMAGAIDGLRVAESRSTYIAATARRCRVPRGPRWSDGQGWGTPAAQRQRQAGNRAKS